MWHDIIQKDKDGRLYVIMSYVLWNAHDPKQNEHKFEDMFDLVEFVKTMQQDGLLVHLHISPYACTEWNYGCSLVPVMEEVDCILRPGSSIIFHDMVETLNELENIIKLLQ